VAETLKIIIQGQDKATSQLRNVNRELDKMEGGAGDAAAEVGRLGSALETFMKFAAIAAGLRMVGKLVWEFAQLGAQAERLEGSFTRLADTQADEMLERLREASRGAISDIDLMQAANQAMMLGVTRDAKQLAQLMEVAIDRGRAMGLSAQQAFSDLVRGIGRMSPLILDNLGIIMDAEKTFGDYAKSIGKTAEELTSAEKRQALLNRVLQESVSITDDAAGSYEVMAAQITNVKINIGQLLELGGVVGFFADLAQSAADYTGRVGEGAEVMAGFRGALRLLKDEGTLTSQEFRELELRAYLVWERFKFTDTSAEELAESLGELHSLALQIGWAFGDAGEGINIFGSALADAEVDVKNLDDTLRALGWKTLEERRLGKTPWQWISKDDIDEAQRLFDGSIEQQQDYLMDMAYGREEANRLQLELDKDAERQTKQHQRNMETLWKQHQRELRSSIEALLQPTAVTELDMARTRLGTYTDQWDEYVRRIRAAVDHLLQPKDWSKLVPKTIKEQGKQAVKEWIRLQQESAEAWKGMIPEDVLARGVDAVKVWAAETEEAFYAGLVPAEINWESFARDYEAFLTKKAGREAMIEEAMARVGGVRVDMEAFLGLAPDLAENTASAAGALGQIGGMDADLGTFDIALGNATTALELFCEAISGIGGAIEGLDNFAVNLMAQIPVGEWFDPLKGKVTDLTSLFDSLAGESDDMLTAWKDLVKGLKGLVQEVAPPPPPEPPAGPVLPNGIELQAGTPFWGGGGAWVGERGPELVNLPAGSRVYNARESRGMGGNISLVQNFYGPADPSRVATASERGILSARRARGLR